MTCTVRLDGPAQAESTQITIKRRLAQHDGGVLALSAVQVSARRTEVVALAYRFFRIGDTSSRYHFQPPARIYLHISIDVAVTHVWLVCTGCMDSA